MKSLHDLDAVSAGSEPFTFDYIDHNGNNTGIKFRVYGGESEAVKSATARLQNERRQRAAAREAAMQASMTKNAVTFDTYEEDVEYGRQLAACRIAGWEGISEPYTPELALQLVRSNSHIAMRVTQVSEALENFIKL